jgi:hypothetical protein
VSLNDYFKIEIPADGVYGVYVHMEDTSKITMGFYDWDRQKWVYSFTPDSTTGLCSGEMKLLAGTYYLKAYLSDGATLADSVDYAFMVFPTEEGSMGGENGAEQSKDKFGSVKDNVYSNEYYGIHFALDSSWEYKTAEEIQEIPEDRENFPCGEEYDVFLAERKDGKLEVNVIVEHMSEDAMEEFSSLGEEGLTDYMVAEIEKRADEAETQGMTVTSVETVKMEFCGAEKYAVRTVMTTSAGVLIQYQIYYIDTEYVGTVVCNIIGEKAEKEVLSMFY